MSPAKGKRSNGKQKGASFERSVCKRLSLWISDLEKEDVFWRSAMSGGRATVYKKAGKGDKAAGHAGDITATDEIGHKLTDLWCIECKYYKSLDVGTYVYSGAGKLASFWEQSVDQAVDTGKMPMLICKENYKPELLILCARGARKISSELHAMCRISHPNQEPMYIFNFSDFITTVDPDEIF